MADNFKLTIGMTTQQVMSNIDRMNATDKTKQMIINFCNNDEDKKISNEIELAMLDSWANGSEKVKMPSADGKKRISSKEAITRGVIFDKIDNKASYYRGARNSVFGTLTRDGSAVAYSSRYINYNPTVDELRDTDNDGYADLRFTSSNESPDYNTEIYTTYADTDLDGKYDTKNVWKSRWKNNSETFVDIETNLHTGEVKKETQTIKHD